MKNDSDDISIIGSRTTEQGLLLKFSDGQYYLFDTRFIVSNRNQRAERVSNPSQWLAENWRQKRVAS
jgi:hypothetical protein